MSQGWVQHAGVRTATHAAAPPHMKPSAVLSGRPFTGTAVELMVRALVGEGSRRQLCRELRRESPRDAEGSNESGGLGRGRSCDVRVGGRIGSRALRGSAAPQLVLGMSASDRRLRPTTDI